MSLNLVVMLQSFSEIKYEEDMWQNYFSNIVLGMTKVRILTSYTQRFIAFLDRHLLV